MSVLCDTQIRELVGIEPFEDCEHRPGRISYGLSSYGYDVRVGTRFKIFTNTTSGGIAVVDPKAFSPDLFIEIDTKETGRDHLRPMRADRERHAPRAGMAGQSDA